MSIPIRPARVKHLIRKELRQLLRDPRSRRIIFLSPIIQLILFGYAVNTDVRHVRTIVADHDRTATSRAVVDALVNSEYFQVTERTDRAGDVRDALDEGRVVTAVVIPPGFTADLESGQGASVQVLVDGTSSNTATVVQGYAGRVLRQFGVEAVSSLRGGGVDAPLQVESRAWFNPALASRVYNVPAVIGTIMFLMSLMLTGLSVAREREVGTFDQLLVSPLSPQELMLGKTLPVAGVAMVQLTLVTTVALLWFGIPFRGSVLLLILSALLYVLSGLSLGLLLSTFSKTQQEAFLTIFLTLFPAIILSGFLYPVDSMPDFFQGIAAFNPLLYFIRVVRAIFLKGAGPSDLVLELGALALMAVVALRVGVARFKALIG
ncbi:MAG: ABC transporter permease [Gemmatimonadota bacterium]|nr:ABC transporter permease [Gemmatimonadota bacterium]